VKISQDKPKEVIVEAKNEAAKANVVRKSVSILCSKGKTMKKISGTNPKCPPGFKKK
jgi:hypothetical protein